jgi:uncharacterized protein (DUF58 family)
VTQLLRAALTRRSRATVRGTHAALARRGDGYEFSELRAYVAGDDLRRIDWAATARAGTPQTRIVFEERGLLLGACIDASPSMLLGRQRSNYDLAREAAHLWFSAANGDDRCARVAGHGLRSASALRGRGAAAFCSQPCADATTLASGLAIAVQAMPRASSLLVISDFFDIDDTEELLRACARRHDLTALVARDPWHAGLPLRGFVNLRDAKGGRSARVFLDAAACERFRLAVAAREAQLCARLARCGARTGLLGEDVPAALLQALGVS